MKKRQDNVFDVTLDDYEQEVSDAIDQALDKGELRPSIMPLFWDW
jgi:hypothetical protein